MTAPATLAERRAALKRLLASGESAIDAYERVLEGASEKDRRSLFKSVPFTRLIPPAVEWEWDAVPEDTVCMCAFLRAALAGSDDAGDDYGARWSGRRGGDRARERTWSVCSPLTGVARLSAAASGSRRPPAAPAALPSGTPTAPFWPSVERT